MILKLEVFNNLFIYNRGLTIYCKARFLFKYNSILNS